MKKFVLFMLFIKLTSSLNAKTWTVSNANGNPAQFSTIAAAIDSATAGDTILVAGSQTAYGNINTAKSLTFIGAGHHPQKQFQFATTINQMEISASNVNFLGFNCGTIYVYNNRQNTRIEFCQTPDLIVYSGVTNCFLKNNLINGRIYLYGGTSNVLISNNVLRYVESNGGVQSGLLIKNNVFRTNPISIYSLNGAIITNNIMYRVSASSVLSNVVNCTINNNITFSTGGASPITNGGASNSYSDNLENVDPLFVSFDATNTPAHYRLQSGSPAKTGGTAGSEMGVYGGGATFSMTGEPPVPVVRSFDILTSSVQSGGSLLINMTASKPRVE